MFKFSAVAENKNLNDLIIHNLSVPEIIVDDKSDRMVAFSSNEFLVKINNILAAKNKKYFMPEKELNEIIYVDFKSGRKFVKRTNSKLFSLVLNPVKEEYYAFDRSRRSLCILNYKDFTIKKERKLDNLTEPLLAERIAFDNNSKTIACIMETGDIIIAGMDNLDILFYKNAKSENMQVKNEYAIYNPFRNSYLLTTWDRGACLEVILDKNNISLRIADEIQKDYQGYSCLSIKNKELYIAYNQRGRIYVYDPETYKLKRKIKTQYTVRYMTYDEDLNILIASGYFTGYVDMFLMDGADKLLGREFVGFSLREAEFGTRNKNLYAASRNGLYRKQIDIKALIEQHLKKS